MTSESKRFLKRGAQVAWLFLLWSSFAVWGADEDKFAKPRWLVTVGFFDSTPAIGSDGTLYFGTFLQKLWAVSSNGVPKWTYTTGSEIRSSPTIAPDGTIYFGCRDRNFYALTPWGSLKWKFETRGWVDSSPALASDGTVYFGSWDKCVYALTPDGNVKWKFKTEGEIATSPVVASDGTILCGSCDGKLYALTPDGAIRWEYKTGGAIMASPALTAVEQARIYVASLDGGLYALDLDGQLIWRLQTGDSRGASPVLGPDGTIYQGVNLWLWAISPEGKKKWEHRMLNYVNAPPAVFEGGVYVVSWEGDLTALDFAGEVQWTAMLHNEYGHAAPALSGSGEIYVQGYSSHLYALDRNKPPVRSAWSCWRGDRRNTGRVTDGAH